MILFIGRVLDFCRLLTNMLINRRTMGRLNFKMPLNPRTAGGRSGFSQIAKKTAARSAAKFAIAVQPTIWHISKKIMTRCHQMSRL